MTEIKACYALPFGLQTAEVGLLKELLNNYIPKNILDQLIITPHGDGNVIHIAYRDKLNLVSYRLLSLTCPLDKVGTGRFESFIIEITGSYRKYADDVTDYTLNMRGIANLVKEIKKVL